MLSHESVSLHGLLHASHQWLGEVSQPSDIPLRTFPQTPFSAMYGEVMPDGMCDVEPEEDNDME